MRAAWAKRRKEVAGGARTGSELAIVRDGSKGPDVPLESKPDMEGLFSRDNGREIFKTAVL